MDTRTEMRTEYRSRLSAQDRASIKGLLFDKDGTLFDFHATWGGWSRGFIERLARGDSRRARALAAALEFDLASARFLKTSPVIAGTMEVMVQTILRVMPELAAEDLRRHLMVSSAHVRPVEAVPLAPLLDRLRGAGLALGVATNDGEAPARAQLEEAGVLDRFDFVAGYDSGFGGKPGTGMLEAFCRALALPAAAVAMVGDSTHDLHAGRAAGMLTIGVLTGPAEAGDLVAHADAVLADVGALPDWLALPAPR